MLLTNRFREEEEAIRRAKLGPRLRPPVHGELVAQGAVLEGELAMAAAEEREESKQVEQEGDHRAEILSESAPTDQRLATGRGFGEGQPAVSPGLRSTLRAARRGIRRRQQESRRASVMAAIVVPADATAGGGTWDERRANHPGQYRRSSGRWRRAIMDRRPRQLVVVGRRRHLEGSVVKIARVGGLHHEYLRRAA